MEHSPQFRPRIEETAQRLHNIAIELQHLEENLYEEIMSSEPLDRARLERLRQVLMLDELVHLKGGVDHLRLILRACIEALSMDRASEEETEQARVLRVTRILRILREQMLAQRAHPKTDTFFERIETLLSTKNLPALAIGGRKKRKGPNVA